MIDTRKVREAGMKVITLNNKKGGVGKTTLAGIIGGGLAMRGKRVLMIDTDQQGNLTEAMGISKRAAFFRFLKWYKKDAPDYTPLIDRDDARNSLIVRVPADTCPDALYVVPGSNETQGIPGSTGLRDMVEGFAWRLKELEDYFDYVIIDTQPSDTPLHDAIALVTDWFLCPIDPEPFAALSSLESAISNIQYSREQSLAMGRDKARIMGIIPNKYRARTVLHESIVDSLMQKYGEMVWEPLPLRTAIPEAQLNSTTLMYAAPQLKTNVHLWSLVDRVLATAEGVSHE